MVTSNRVRFPQARHRYRGAAIRRRVPSAVDASSDRRDRIMVMNPRIRAVCDLQTWEAREFAGLHDYDGVPQDLSPSGVAAGLAALGAGPKDPDRHDEDHLAAAEAGMRAIYQLA